MHACPISFNTISVILIYLFSIRLGDFIRLYRNIIKTEQGSKNYKITIFVHLGHVRIFIMSVACSVCVSVTMEYFHNIEVAPTFHNGFRKLPLLIFLNAV